MATRYGHEVFVIAERLMHSEDEDVALLASAVRQAIRMRVRQMQYYADPNRSREKLLAAKEYEGKFDELMDSRECKQAALFD